MRIITHRTLREYAASHADVKLAIDAWYRDVKAARWSSWAEIKSAYPSASIIGNSRVCWNIKGNNYRLVAAVFLGTGVVMIKFVGTHAEYTKMLAETGADEVEQD